MKTDSGCARYTVGEEIANSITHGIGILLAIGGLGVLTGFASVHGDRWHVVSCSIYAATMILLYSASTLYHIVQAPRAKSVLQIADHSAIYLLIAGTYTPFSLVSLRGPLGWSLLALVWALAAAGILLEIKTGKRRKAFGTALYLGMGWIIVVAWRPLVASIGTGGMVLYSPAASCIFFPSSSTSSLWHKPAPINPPPRPLVHRGRYQEMAAQTGGTSLTN